MTSRRTRSVRSGSLGISSARILGPRIKRFRRTKNWPPECASPFSIIRKRLLESTWRQLSDYGQAGSNPKVRVADYPGVGTVFLPPPLGESYKLPISLGEPILG